MPNDRFKVGDKVRALSECVEEGEDSPRQPNCAIGDTLTIRRVLTSRGWDYRVSREGVTDNSFGVMASEIEGI